MDAQDGPWTISVAENPHDQPSYSLYVKTPTHNLTLSRTAREIVDLDHKLHDSFPHVVIPALPLDPHALPQPAKRKSAFLNTLSRLASPSAKSSSARHPFSSQPSGPRPSNLPTPLTSPPNEAGDPFSVSDDVLEPLSTPTTTNPVITGLAAYLTTLSNDQMLRQARAWKRFVRVRTDDLESVRVERAIKRVRSDLGAHMVSPSTVNVHVLTSESTKTEDKPVNGDRAVKLERRLSRFREEIQEEEPRQDDSEPEPIAEEEEMPTPEERSETPRSPEPSTATSELASIEPSETDSNTTAPAEEAPATPIATEIHAARIPRSQSADPDKAVRMSRLFSPSTVSAASGTTSLTESQTEDDSSIGTSQERSRTRKKRSKSMDPNRELKKRERAQRKVQVSDFEMMRVLGKGCAGKVLLVRHKSSADLYALKAITKRHVLAHQELQHTLTEQAVLRRMAAEGSDPFVVKLWWSFHDKENLFLVMDFHPGGDLATQLARWGRLGRDRARFYAAEIVEGVEGLHAAGVIYRDLKPENILIAADGHIVLTDFGLSKEFPRRSSAITAPSTPNGHVKGFALAQTTPPAPYWLNDEKGGDLASPWPSRLSDQTTTFCGTAEYLAPEVIQGLPYSYEVDWWSFGTMLYEMLTGITPFWADNHSDMYVRVLQDELQFPDDRSMDQDTKSLIRGLLQRNPGLRLSEPRIKRHPYFSMIDWSHVYYKRYIPPYIPPIDPQNASDTQNFDDTFLDMEPVINDVTEGEDTDQEGGATDTDRTDGEDSVATPSQSRSSSAHPQEDESVDVFDGYSFKGRHSVILDGDEEVSGSSEGDEGDEEDEEGSTKSILAEINGTDPAKAEETPVAHDEETPEPKTPEARLVGLPETPTDASTAGKDEPAPTVSNKPAQPTIITDLPPRVSEEAPAPPPKPPSSPSSKANALAAAAAAAAANNPDIHRKEIKKTAVAKPVSRKQRNRREKSGVPYLDRDLSDANEEDEVPTERDDEDDDWDFIEADGEDRNGSKGTSLFARGVVDRYKLSVFRKGSTPNRSVSGVSQMSESNASVTSNSPSPAAKERRGRSALPFRRAPKQFLQPKSPKSPQSTRSSQSNTLAGTKAGKSGMSLNHSVSTTLSTTSSRQPRSSYNNPESPSLRSRQSETSFGSPHSSSDTSMNEENRIPEEDVTETIKKPPGEDQENKKNNKLKKYKEGAEKVLSLFASPR
ncbi:hypothetical protein OF83DRAFT_1170172 [Amylostereum chailletii]|nr:hypothetical protein OF83DRAFT_1170172 [Amylostereum chailletii]